MAITYTPPKLATAPKPKETVAPATTPAPKPTTAPVDPATQLANEAKQIAAGTGFANPNNQTAQGMNQQAQTQMEDRVKTQAVANPNQLITGAQMGAMQTGTEMTPVTFQAVAYNNGLSPAQKNPSPSTVSPAPTPGLTPSGSGSGTTTPTSQANASGTGTGATDVTIPQWKAADTSSIDSQIDSVLATNKTPQQIDEDLRNQIDAIQQRFATRAGDISRKYANVNAEQFSDLAGLGANPLSSGASNVANLTSRNEENELANDRMQMNAEISAARAAAAGAKTDAQQMLLANLRQKREDLVAQTDKDYQMRRQYMDDTVASMNRAVAAAKEGKTSSNAERDDARANVKDWFSMFGSKAFDNVSAEDKRALEKAAGLPAGSIDLGATTLKEQEIAAKNAAKANDFQFVAGTKNQAAGYFDKTTGKFVPFSNAGGAPRTGTGTGSGAATGVSGITKAMEADLKAGRADLASGIPWGDVFDRIKTKYPTLPNSTLDSQLGTSWRQGGAYENTLKRAQEYRGNLDPLAAILNQAPKSNSGTSQNSGVEFTDDEVNEVVNDLRF